jgi:proline dehydrogenase
MSVLDRAVSLLLPALPKPVVRFFSRRYIAGPTMEDAFRVVGELADQGAMSTLDILGELITSTEDALRNADAYSELIRRVAENRLAETHVSVKLTALGLLLDRELCLNHMRRLLERTTNADGFVRIDMEDSSCTSDTLWIYETLRGEFPGRIGVVLQSALRRTLDDVDRLTHEPANIRLCKGIYIESRTVAYTDPEIIRRNYVLALERMLQRRTYVGIATHDEQLTWEALRLIRQHSLRPHQYEFQMLLGVDEELRGILLNAGHRLRVYVPFGEHWHKYSVRRLRENPKIAGYAFKALFRKRPAPIRRALPSGDKLQRMP